MRLLRVAIVALLALGILAAPVAAEGQQPGKVYRLGLLSPTSPPVAGQTAVSLIVAALRELGYVEDENLVIERRYAEGKFDRLPALARDLVQLGVGVIVAISPVAVEAARDVTQTVPIVMFAAGDPVARGFVASLARPGRNITGVVIAETGLADKRLALLKEAIPRVTRVAILVNGEDHVRDQAQEAQKAARALGLALAVVNVRGDAYEQAFAKMVSARAQALLVPASSLFNRDRRQIIALALKHRLPVMYQWRESAEEGGLMAYGSSIAALSRRAASYIDRIFRGVRPADLPMEQPISYELVINLKTAKALGLTIPPSVLARADQVIE